MENISLKDKDINNYINKKTKEREKDKSIEKLIYYLSDKKDNNSSSFIKLFLYNNNNESQNDISNKKFIKVNTDNNLRTKNKIKSLEKINNDKKTKKTLKEIDISEDDNLTISEKINKFESRIDNLLDLINDFENKFIYSEETQRIKDQFNDIMNKKIYKNKTSKDFMYKSWIKTEKKNDIFPSQENSNVLKDNCFIDIKNINISINNNNYENNYYITQTSQNIDSHPRTFRKKQNCSEKKINININNNSIFKKSIIKTAKKKIKCISNDIKNKILKNYKDKSKVFKLPLDFIINNNNANKNNYKNYRYNHTYKEFQKPLTERNKKDNKYKINEKLNFDKILKSANKKKHNCLIIKNLSPKNDEIAKKPLIKKEGIKKTNLLNSKKKLFNKNSTPSSIIKNSLANNTIIGGKTNKEKNVVNYSQLSKNKESNNNHINYTLNKKKIIKRNNVITFFNNFKDNDNKQEPINKKI